MEPTAHFNRDNTAGPRATYRLQFHEGFTLNQARALVPYLHEIGISHIYSSPLFKARPHSTHGYDTCDFTQLNPELGTEADLAELAAALRAFKMGLILDIAPNHMGIGGPENRWWWDVLARGPESQFAKFFDIDWNSADPRLRGKVLTPVLGDRYHRLVEKHELRVENSRGTCILRYGDNSFPINGASLKAVRVSLEELNSNPEALDALLEMQFYRLAWFGGGDSDLNYRRFCNISSLPRLCIEDEQVFNQVFALTGQWLQHGWLDGLRVDHIDGLKDPDQFLQRLRRLAPKSWIVVEKILEPGETLPPSWAVAGTTGYDFLNQAGDLLVDPESEKVLTDLHVLYGGAAAFPPLARDKKRLVSRTLFAAEVENLTHLLVAIAAGGVLYRDFTRDELSAALIECLACFPVYRSYVRPPLGSLTESDACHILRATREARRARPDLPPDLIEFVGGLLLLKEQGSREAEFVTRFQQLSAAVMAKGVEDTAFYCFNRFVALNEVGGDPGTLGVSVSDFHESCRRQQSDWPTSMLATSTHDTKRSEDVRSRLYLLSEIPRTWRDAVARWSTINQCHRRHGWPDRNTEYFFYQTLVGAWPLSAERAIAYMHKAVHEAKEKTTWSDPNAEYDDALSKFVSATLADPNFVADMDRFVEPLRKPGCINSLALTLLKLVAPGVPDIYQGTEIWDLSLVDPDNRRPVDFAQRADLLAETAGLPAEDAWGAWSSGLPKLWLIQHVLKLRAQRPDLFDSSAAYRPMTARGEAAKHAVVFLRGESLIALVPRLVISLQEDWRGTVLDLPPGQWRNALTSEPIPRADAPIDSLLAKFPVALLVREENV